MKSRVIGMKIKTESSGPCLGQVTDSIIDNGIEWITVDNSFEVRLSEYEEVWELTGPPVGPYLRQKSRGKA